MDVEFNLNLVRLPMKKPMKSAKGEVSVRDTIIVRIVTDTGAVGYGECPAFMTPFYTEETLPLAWEYLSGALDAATEDFLAVLNELSYDGDGWDRVPFSMSRHALLNAADGVLESIQGMEMSTVGLYLRTYPWGGVLPKPDPRNGAPIRLGLVLSDYSVDHLCPLIESGLKAGAKKFKCKVSPNNAYDKMEELMFEFPGVQFAVDANGSFDLTGAGWEELQALAELPLDYIEEPFTFTDWKELNEVQRKLSAPLCYDESVQSPRDIVQMHRYDAGLFANIKIPKMGGVHRTCQTLFVMAQTGIAPVYGNLLESGIGKLQQAQLASLIPSPIIGDMSDSNRYFPEDLIADPIQFHRGKYVPPQGQGIGSLVREDILEKYTVKQLRWTAETEATPERKGGRYGYLN